jgi:hypothetical protein
LRVTFGVAAALDHLGAERGNCDRRFLHVFRAELRGDDDFFEPARPVAVLRERKQWQSSAHCNRRGAQRAHQS